LLNRNSFTIAAGVHATTEALRRIHPFLALKERKTLSFPLWKVREHVGVQRSVPLAIRSIGRNVIGHVTFYVWSGVPGRRDVALVSDIDGRQVGADV
jgi:hypothetical protein